MSSTAKHPHTAPVTKDPSLDPVLCSPYDEPDLHWELDHLGRAIKGKAPIVGRRPSMWIRSAPKDTKKSRKQSAIYLPTQDLNQTINSIRQKVTEWRNSGYPGATSVTRQLLHHWADGEQATKRPFFAQREAIETLIWLREVATRRTPERYNIEEQSRMFNDGIVRHCVKQATGTGKTLVMAMLIAWQTLNAVRTSRSRNIKHGQRFAVLTPGLTVRDRLSVLQPTHTDNIYDEYGLVPSGVLRRNLNRANVQIVNWQAFQPRDLLARYGGTKQTRELLQVDDDHGLETRRDAAERVLRNLISPSSAYGDLVVINDEAHHCWLPGQKEGAEGSSEDKKAAAVWFNAIAALRDGNHLGRHDTKYGQASIVYDFSATPMWIDTTARSRSRLFEWVVSDFGLMESIESGLVKVPRVPCDDDTNAEQTIWRNLHKNTKPKTIQPDGVPLQEPLAGAMSAVYSDYERVFQIWENTNMKTPPVMIVVANNITAASALYDWISGTEGRGQTFRAGNLPLFSNVREDGSGWHRTPRTLLVHSQLDTSEKITGKFAKLAKQQVERFGLPVKKLSDAMRHMMNTVGKPGKPGEQVRCVVSVSMLTEGWDTSTVTHILGYRPFSTQLLCEQVTGRALRRVDYDNWRNTRINGKKRSLLHPEYAEVVGIPFEFMPSGPSSPSPTAPKPIHHVYTMPERSQYRVTFPMVEQYMLIPPPRKLTFYPELVQPYNVTIGDIPTMTLITGVAGEEHIIKVSQKDTRKHTAATALAAILVRQFILNNPDRVDYQRAGLFRGAYQAVEQWVSHPKVTIPDNDYKLLLRADHHTEIVKQILDACRPTPPGEPIPVAKLCHPPLLGTGNVDFETTLQNIHNTRKSELNIAACHSRLEVTIAQQLDEHPQVESWARNFQTGWTIPYRAGGVWHPYTPDFIAKLANGHNLIVEGKGMPDPNWETKKRFVENDWIPSVSNTETLDKKLREWTLVTLTNHQEIRNGLDKAIQQTYERSKNAFQT